MFNPPIWIILTRAEGASSEVEWSQQEMMIYSLAGGIARHELSKCDI